MIHEKIKIEIILLIIILLSSHYSLLAQGRIHNGAVYQGLSYEQMLRPLLQAQQAYDQTLNDIKSIRSQLSGILAQGIDTQLRTEINKQLKELDGVENALKKYGSAQSARAGLDRVIKDVTQAINSYNNRVAEARAKAEEEARIATQTPKEWSGSGFALKERYVVTNYHVVEDAKSIQVYGIQGNTSTGLDARILATDRINDLAIIEITDSRFSGFGTIPYAINKQMLDVGEDIWVLGYPLTQVLGNEIKLTNGIISSRSGYQGDVSTYQISAPLQPGNSGGPIFDSKGNIAGIINAGVPGAENIGYAIKAAYLYLLIDNYSLSDYVPTNNAISSLSLKDKVKKVNDFVFLLKCSSIIDPSKNNTTHWTTSDRSSGLTRISEGMNEASSNTSVDTKEFIPHKGNHSGIIKTVYNPEGGSNDSYHLEITKIELSETLTRIHCRYTSYAESKWCWISSKAYITGPSGDSKKQIINAENIPFYPDKHEFHGDGETLDFVLEFPGLDSYRFIRYCKLIEPDGWKFYEIILDK